MDEEAKKTELQIENIKRVVKELYEKREKKIVSMALDRSRTRSDIFDTTVMLAQERDIFNLLVEVLNKGRNEILTNMVNKPKDNVNVPKQLSKMVRFLTAVPKFVGSNLEQYGPFQEEDIANLPTQIADILINKQRAEELNEE